MMMMFTSNIIYTYYLRSYISIFRETPFQSQEIHFARGASFLCLLSTRWDILYKYVFKYIRICIYMCFIYVYIYVYTEEHPFYASYLPGGISWLFIVGLFCLFCIICMMVYVWRPYTTIIRFVKWIWNQHPMYRISDMSCLQLSCCINAFVFCVHYLCLIERVYVFYVGYVDKRSLHETLFHCNICFHFLCLLLMPYWTSLCVLRRTCRQA
jgi:hypothetical protein